MISCVPVDTGGQQNAGDTHMTPGSMYAETSDVRASVDRACDCFYHHIGVGNGIIGIS